MTKTAMTPTSQEKPRMQVKSALHQEVSDFNLSENNEYGIAHQSGTKPPGRGQEAPQGEHEVDRTYKQWTLRQTGFKMANQERQIDAL